MWFFGSRVLYRLEGTRLEDQGLLGWLFGFRVVEESRLENESLLGGVLV